MMHNSEWDPGPGKNVKNDTVGLTEKFEYGLWFG